MLAKWSGTTATALEETWRSFRVSFLGSCSALKYHVLLMTATVCYARTMSCGFRKGFVYVYHLS